MIQTFQTNKPVLFTGDVGGVRPAGRNVVQPPCPPPDIHIENWLASIEILEKSPAQHLFLTHFGQFDDKEAHLQRLKASLLDWAGWMRPHYEDQTPFDEVTALFYVYVQGQLEAAGLNAQDRQILDKANPSFMSVAGLLRYWKKKETPV